MDGELEAVFVFWPRFTSVFYSRLTDLGTQSLLALRSMPILGAQRGDDLFVDLVNGLVAGDIDQYSPLPVEPEHRRGFCVVDLDPLLDGRRGVVVTLIEFTAALVALLAFFTRTYGVGGLTGPANVTAAQPA